MKLTKQSLFYIGIVVGAIGAVGQALLLFHELTDCLPYKEIGLGVYQSIARTGVWIAPVASVTAATYFSRKTPWLAVVMSVIVTPLFFAMLYKIYSLIYGLDIGHAGGDFTPFRAQEQFYSYCLSLIGVGVIVGMVLGYVLQFIANRKELA